jgi:hypothetical protein
MRRRPWRTISTGGLRLDRATPDATREPERAGIIINVHHGLQQLGHIRTGKSPQERWPFCARVLLRIEKSLNLGLERRVVRVRE